MKLLPKSFLFDFDGTLVESSPLHQRAFETVLARHRPDLLASFDYGTVKGLPTREAMKRAGVDDDEMLSRLTAEKQQAFRAAVQAGELEPIAGARDLLESLRSAGHRLFLVTSGSRDSVTLSLGSTRLAEYFSGIITSDDVERGKPAPDPFLLCLARHSISPTVAFVVEDAPSGIASARAAGLAVIGVNNPDVAGLADYYFSTLGELQGWTETPTVWPGETK